MLKPETRINEYQILAVIGHSDGRVLYLALKGETRYWLLESSMTLAHLESMYQNSELFEQADKRYLAFGVKGTSVATLARLVSTLEPAYIGWRWAELARDLGYLHKNGIVYQREHIFSLDKVIFKADGKLFPLTEQTTGQDALRFPAPEMANVPATIASDVYALGASLLALLGETPGQAGSLWSQNKSSAQISSGLKSVLHKATSVEPSKRYREANAFGLALTNTLPEPARLVPAAQKKSRVGAVVLTLLVLVVLCMAVSALAWRGLGAIPNSVFTLLETGALAAKSKNVQASPDTLALKVVDLAFATPCMFSFKTELLANDAPLDADTLVSTGVWANDEPLTLVQREEGPNPNPGSYRLRASAPNFCSNGGTLRVGARVGNAVANTSYFYSVPIVADATSNLAELGISSIQLDTQNYPMIDTYLSVTDAAGSTILLKGPFQVQVFQDDKPVDDFLMLPVNASEIPLTVALVLDVSGSMKGPPIEAARRAASDFVSALGENDSVCLYTFSTEVHRAVKCTTDKKVILDALDSLQVGEDTALYDVLTAVAQDHARRSGRQAVLLLSDGADTASRTKPQDALARVQAVNLPIHTIGLTSKDFRGQVLQEIAQVTGGSWLEAPSSSDLEALYARVRGQLANQYLIKFRSRSPELKQGVIEIRFMDGVTLVSTKRNFTVMDENP